MMLRAHRSHMPHQHRTGILTFQYSRWTEARLARSHDKDRTGLPAGSRPAANRANPASAPQTGQAPQPPPLRKKLTAPARHFTSSASPSAPAAGSAPPLRATLSTTRNLPAKARSHKMPTANRPRQSHRHRRLARISPGQRPVWKSPAIELEPITCRLTGGLYRAERSAPADHREPA